MRACLYAGVTGPGGASFRFALQAQGEYHSARVAQVANHLRSGRWRDLGEAGRNEHTVSHCTLRMLQYVYDFLSEARPVSGALDIGAFERVTATAPPPAPTGLAAQ